MKVVEPHRKDLRVTCPECGSIIELENSSEEWDWYSRILDCPVCHKYKTRNV